MKNFSGTVQDFLIKSFKRRNMQFKIFLQLHRQGGPKAQENQGRDP